MPIAMREHDSIYINPLTDFGFKYLFGQEEHKQFLLSFLNALFKGQREITDVEFIDKEKIGEDKEGRAYPAREERKRLGL